MVAIPVSAEPVELVHGARIEAVPVAAWKAGLRYVTAVKLTNRTQNRWCWIRENNFAGPGWQQRFSTTVCYLRAMNADTTAVYLISDRPFDVAL